MCEMSKSWEANKAVNRTQQKIRQLGIPKKYVAVLECFTGQRLHGYLEYLSLSILAWSSIK